MQLRPLEAGQLGQNHDACLPSIGKPKPADLAQKLLATWLTDNECAKDGLSKQEQKQPVDLTSFVSWQHVSLSLRAHYQAICTHPDVLAISRLAMRKPQGPGHKCDMFSCTQHLMMSVSSWWPRGRCPACELLARVVRMQHVLCTACTPSMRRSASAAASHMSLQAATCGLDAGAMWS